MARPFRGTQRKLKNRYIWELSTGSFSGQAAGSSSLQFSSVGTIQTTLVRIRGEVMGYIDGAPTPGDLTVIHYGIILVEEGAGASTRYNPALDANAPWLLYGTASLGYEEMVTDVVDVPGITSFRHVIDNKAMRIIRPDQEMQFALFSTTTFTATPVNVAYSLRFLQQSGKR